MNEDIVIFSKDNCALLSSHLCTMWNPKNNGGNWRKEFLNLGHPTHSSSTPQNPSVHSCASLLSLLKPYEYFLECMNFNLKSATGKSRVRKSTTPWLIFQLCKNASHETLMELNALFHRRSWLNRDEKSLPSIFATFLQALSSCNRWVGAIFSIHSEMSYAIKVKPNFSHKNCKLSSRASFRFVAYPAYFRPLGFLFNVQTPGGTQASFFAHCSWKTQGSCLRVRTFAILWRFSAQEEVPLFRRGSHSSRAFTFTSTEGYGETRRSSRLLSSISRGFILSGDTFYNYDSRVRLKYSFFMYMASALSVAFSLAFTLFFTANRSFVIDPKANWSSVKWENIRRKYYTSIRVSITFTTLHLWHNDGHQTKDLNICHGVNPDPSPVLLY